MAIGGLSSSRKLLARRRLQKRSSARRILMETLESRQLMAVGPQLLGIQPNSGDLLDNGEILNVSPREFKLRFDDAAGIDAATLSGIRIIRSGDDGVFERASMATDFGTNGQTLVEFYAQQAGESGNGITVRFTRASRTDSRLPIVTNNGREVTIQLNSNPALETRVQDLIQVLDPSKTTPATTLIYALRLRGSDTIGVATSVDTTRPLVLSGANSGKVTTSFGQSSALQVRLTAVDSGNSGLGISVVVTGRDRGGAGLPIISINNKTINVELNTNTRFATTVQEFVDALNTNSQSSGLIQARLVSGSGSTRLGSLAINYSPLQLSGVLDVEVIPAYVGLGDNNHEVIVRFAESLPDDKYRIEILGQGTRTLRNVNGQAFNSGVSRSVAFELDLGAQIESIVPQPVTRNAAGQLVQQRSQIEVYFNNDDLIDVNQVVSVNGLSLATLKTLRSPLFFQNGDTIVFAAGAVGSTTAINPNFYQLFHTAGTLTNADDTRFLPTAVRYFPDSDRVTLSFSRNLDELTNSANVPLPLGELRLRIGTNEAVPLPPVVVTPATDAADTFAGATNLNSNWTPGVAGSQSVLINSAILNTSPYLLDFPGGSNEPGNRQIRMQDNLRLGADTVDGTSVIFYNFQAALGTIGTLTFSNAITEQQKQRVREIFSLYENYLGVRFVESTNLGMTIAVGDMLAVTPFPDLPGSTTPGIVEGNQPGSTTFEAGTLRTNNQPAAVLDIQDFSDSTRNAYGGPFMRAAMQAIGRLLGLGNADELPSLTIQSDNAVFVPGVGTEIILPGDGDIVHGQFLYRPDSKDIDLYQFSVPTAGRISIEAFAERMSQASLLDTTLRLYQQNVQGGWDEIAVNDDYFSSDSMIELELAKGNYIVGVSASGNSNYDPTISDSGLGGRSEGRYQLRMDFLPPATGILRDSTGTAFDGNSDGTPGGTYDFWFRPSGPSNTKFVDKAAATTGNGTLATPYRFIKDALAAAQPGDVVRIVGNGGADGRLSTPADNLAYEIGFDTTQGRALPDGSTFDVPKDVAVIIDAGAILKLRRARIGVGSTSVNVDRSAGSLMVLGTPLLLDSTGAVIKDSSGNNVAGDVYMTSVSDTTLGRNANPAVTGSTPAAGDWGGIDFRNRIDASTPARENLEALGTFLNWVSHADMRFGGGQVVIDGQSQVVTPIQMVDARPTVAFSRITSSSDAAMSATPNSFLESNFQSPLEQGATSFTVDYDRVGPDIHNNRMTGNSLNGLQIRLRTGTSTQLEKLTVQARFDDIDIVHIIPENLEIAGSAGGALQQVAAPSSAGVTLTVQAGGTLPTGLYNYRLSFLDAAGVESPASEPTASVFGTSAVQLRNLPQGVRRIYRSSANGAGPYTLIAQLPAAASAYTDNGTSLGTLLADTLPAVVSRLDARLAIDAGTVVKSQGSRIDVAIGSQIIAEGSEGLPVVFTSIVDARYGAGGTFDTANRAGSQTAAPGDWGGIYVGPTSKASLDHAVIAYGGGTARIEGGFADFNAIESHQGELRLANSRLELNGSGAVVASTDPERGGRLGNSVGTVFVRGSQPIIVNNIINDNLGPALSANVSALNSALVDDYGRSTGQADFYTAKVGNRGPMISGNRLDNNDINGFVVRGGELTTEGVWDDTDIVHVVQSEITIPDYHVYGGLRLTSSPAESLVVKLSGANAGFTAEGTPLDNADRIGGSVQMVGNPGYPVVLTSLEDCSVGAGFTLGGAAQNDTHNSGLCGPTTSASFADVIVVIDESGSMFGAQQFTVGMINDLDQALLRSGIGSSAAGANRFGLVGFGDSNDVGRSVPVGGNNQLFGTSTQYGAAVQTLTINGAIEDGYEGINHALENYTFRPNAQKFIILVTDEDRDIVTPSLTFQSILGDLRAEGVNLQGILGTFTVDQNFNPAIALDSNNVAYTADGNGGFTTSPNGQFLFGSGTTIPDYADLVFATGGIVGDISEISQGGLVATSFSNALVSSIVLQAGGSLAAPGDWRSVLLDTYSNDRNVAVVNELESPIASAASSNNTTAKSQFLGSIAPNEKAGDENQRLGFQLQGVLSQPGDVDVYSFRANAGTEVWLDIDRTLNSIDTVVELVDADGRTLALSNDSLAEEANPSLLFRAAELDAQSVNPLRRSSTDFYYTSAQGAPKDLFSTNPKDAGFRVKLPGEAGLNNLYHVRVRSSNLRPGDAASRLLDPAQVGAGRTQGSYQLQIRLSEVDEVPGSGISNVDIRFARNGLSFVGVPGNSPLLGENAEIEITASGASNNQFANAQNLGNLLQTNRQALSVAGNLNSFTDVDWYSFDIDYQKISATGLREYFATVLDVDYADGIGRPDTSIYLFNAAGSLILGGLSSNLVDDQASPGSGSGNSDLSRGSAGGRDPFVGSYELPSGRYFLAITNSLRMPEALTTYTDPNSNAPGLRMQPIEGVRLIVEDHIESQGGSTAVPPVTPVLFNNNSIVQYGLGDVKLYVSQDVGQELTNIYTYNPYTGERKNQVGRVNFDLQDIAFRDNGQLRAFDRAIESQATGDRDVLVDYVNIDPGTAATTATAAGLQTLHIEFTNGVPAPVASDDGTNPEAFTFGVVGGQERGYVVTNRPTPAGSSSLFYTPVTNSLANVGLNRPGPSYFTNILYEFDENSGAAISAPFQDKTGVPTGLGAGTAIVDRGFLETRPILPNGTVSTTLRSSTLVAREVTTANSNGSPNRVIRDGQTFTLLDSVNFPARFEFDMGLDLRVNYDPANGRFVRDGMKFTLDGIDYEFDTGSVVVVSALSGAFLADGST
ncbi:MAG: VWA domain-containing protein, partial [Pirellulaceae bacterium]|nr:VWA domain-containing protein [Pirellulaceae bacterium]